MMIVSEDSMGLIFLAKLDLIKESRQMLGELIISKEVERETTSPHEIYPDAVVIRKSIEEGLVEVRAVRSQEKVTDIMKKFGLGKGEAETVQLYLQENADLLLCDEKKARRVAAVLGINLLGTPELVIQLKKRKFIGSERAKESILALEKTGWFNSSIIFEALKEIGD